MTSTTTASAHTVTALPDTCLMISATGPCHDGMGCRRSAAGQVVAREEDRIALTCQSWAPIGPLWVTTSPSTQAPVRSAVWPTAAETRQMSGLSPTPVVLVQGPEGQSLAKRGRGPVPEEVERGRSRRCARAIRDCRQHRAPWPLRGVPAGRGGGAAVNACEHPAADRRPAATAAARFRHKEREP
jgi:hypothetical protein